MSDSTPAGPSAVSPPSQRLAYSVRDTLQSILDDERREKQPIGRLLWLLKLCVEQLDLQGPSPVSGVRVEELEMLDKAAAHLVGFCRQVAHDGILPSLAWFSEASETVDALRAELVRLRGPAAVSEAPLDRLLDVLSERFDALTIAEVKAWGGLPIFAGHIGQLTTQLREAVAGVIAEHKRRGADPGVRPDAPEGT